MFIFLLSFFLIIPSFATNSSSATTTTSSEEEVPGQIYSKDIIGWIVTFSATIPPAAGLVYTAIQIKNDSNARHIQTLREIEKDISDLYKDRKAADGSNERIIWEANFLNTMERNAFLMRSKRYPKDLLDIFKNDFGYALHLIGDNASRRRDFPEILGLCNEKQWQSYNADQ